MQLATLIDQSFPKAETVVTIEALLPGNLSKDQIRLG
jgi:hypothetical protein